MFKSQFIFCCLGVAAGLRIGPANDSRNKRDSSSDQSTPKSPNRGIGVTRNWIVYNKTSATVKGEESAHAGERLHAGGCSCFILFFFVHLRITICSWIARSSEGLKSFRYL